MDVEQEDRTLRIIMIISFIGMIDSIYLSYLHHLVAGGSGCPTQDLPGLENIWHSVESLSEGSSSSGSNS